MNWLMRKMANAVVRQLTVREVDGWVPQSSQADTGEAVSDHVVLSLSAVWACVNLLAGTIGSLPVMVYQRDGNAKVPMPDHSLYRLLHDSPNYDQTAVDFWEFMQASIELWGNGYARKVIENGKIIALEPISPNLVVVRRLENGSIEYQWTDRGRTRRHLDVEILHIRGFGGNPLGGMSTLHYGRNAFGLARAVDKASGATFKNGLRPSGALVFKEFLSEANRKVAEEKLAERFAGAVNAGRPMILEGGTTWTPLAINPEDAQMLESRRFSVEEVCRFFGVPPHMVGHTENSTSWGTGLEQQTLGFQKFTLRRRLKRIEQALEKQLLTPTERMKGVFIEFSLEGLLRGDSAGRATFYKEMTSIGAMTINDVRAFENLPPVEGGDVPRIQTQNQPISQTPGMTPIEESKP
tara:strand:- start:43283 stop:44509 length:1227 start_codon:yes stop_codon:yes gene_type:complete